jgi:hypothetical protein
LIAESVPGTKCHTGYFDARTVQQPPVKHEVEMKDFVSWLGRQGRSPAEVMLKQSWRKY